MLNLRVKRRTYSIDGVILRRGLGWFYLKNRPDIGSHLDEQKVEELEKAAIMADDYALTHKMSSKSGNPQQKRYHGSGNREKENLFNRWCHSKERIRVVLLE